MAAIEEKKRAGRVMVEILVSEDVQEMLDNQAASDELLRFWLEREEEAYPKASPVQAHLADDARAMAIQFMHYLIRERALDWKAWLGAVTLLDAYGLHATSPMDADELPAFCWALVSILHKMEQHAPDMDEILLQRLHSRTRDFAASLTQAGHCANLPVTGLAKLAAQEFLITEVLRWRITLPTTESWLSAFCARMNTLTQDRMKSTFMVVWQQSMALAGALTLQRSYGPSFSPVHVARGMISLGCVAAALLPSTMFGLGPEEPIFFGIDIPKMELKSKMANEFFAEVLELATMASATVLQTDFLLVHAELQRRAQ